MVEKVEKLKTVTILFGQALIDFYRVHLGQKVRVERGKSCTFPSKFVESWVNMARMARVNGPTLSMRL